MALYTGLLNNTCIIYRQTAVYDAGSTDYGEIEEVWAMVKAGVKCRTDGSLPSYITRSGIVEMGTKMMYIEADIDLQDNDIVYVDGDYFSVIDVKPVYGYSELHHKEVPIKRIKFISPS